MSWPYIFTTQTGSATPGARGVYDIDIPAKCTTLQLGNTDRQAMDTRKRRTPRIPAPALVIRSGAAVRSPDVFLFFLLHLFALSLLACW